MPKTSQKIHSTPNIGQAKNMGAKKHHVEVGEFNIEKKSNARIFFETLAHTAARSSTAVDDSYGVYSSIAGVGFRVITFPFIILGFFLSIGYTIAKYYKNDRSEIELTKESFEEYAEKTITQAHYDEWQRKLDYIRPVLDEKIDPAKKKIDIRVLVRQSIAEELLEQIRIILQDLKTQKATFKQFKVDLHDEKLRRQLSLYNERIKLLRKRLTDNLKNLAFKVSDKKLKKAIIAMYNQEESNTEKQKNAKYYFKKAWGWIVNNYQRIITGITIAATLASLSMLLFGYSIAMAIVLPVLVTTLVLVYKLYFEKRIKNIYKAERRQKSKIVDKALVTSEFVETKVIASDLTHAMFEYKIAATKKSKKESAELAPELKPTEPKSADEPIEHDEVKELRKQNSKARKVLLFILPAILAFNTGYGIGATLLQLAVISHFLVPVLPFIILGASFAALYVTHALFTSYYKFKDEQGRIKKLNTDVITENKTMSRKNALRLININRIQHSGEFILYEDFVKRTNTNELADRIVSLLESIRKLKDLPDNFGIENVYRRRINVLSAEVKTLHSEELKEKLTTGLRLPTTKKDEKKETGEKDEDAKDTKKPNKFTAALYKMYRFITYYLKPAAQGTAFGLSMGASLVIFLYGASSLVTLAVSITIITCGAIFGMAISISNKILKDKSKEFSAKIDAQREKLEDKDRLLEMHKELEKDLQQAKKIDTVLYGRSSQKTSGDATPTHSPRESQKQKTGLRPSKSMPDLKQLMLFKTSLKKEDGGAGEEMNKSSNKRL